MAEKSNPQLNFATQLLQWFGKRKRDLPWRNSQDPYHIWVSEIMLQQTRVETVIPYFKRFIEQFPTTSALAEAPEAEVLKLWEGLGYYSRARNLQAAVREVQANYGGNVPQSADELRMLPGIGPYTAGAISSIAFQQPEPAVDGNVLRVMARYFAISDDIAKGATRVKIENLIRPLIPSDAAGDFTQALMELGSLVCVPRRPKCEECPVASGCAARADEVQHELPVKSKAKQQRHEYRLVALLQQTVDGRIYFCVRQRPSTGLLAELWEPPHIEVTEGVFPDESEAIARLTAAVEGAFSGVEYEPTHMLDIEHVFSHIHWHLRVYRFWVRERVSGSTWICADEMERHPFPLVFLKIIRQGLLT